MVERVVNENGTRRRWVWRALLAAIVVVAVAVIFGSRFYRTIQAPHWDALNRAQQEALGRLDLHAIDTVERFVGDRPYTVVTATYAEDVPVIAWMWDDEVRVERRDAGISREDASAAALAKHPDLELLRVSPGRLGEEFVWEVFYQLREPGGIRKYYDYFRFRDGKNIETYRLALERK